MDDWDQVCAFALGLPDVELASWWGRPCPKLNGKGLLSPGGEPGSFALMVAKPEKELLLETDPDTFWQTAHYANFPMLLVRYGAPARERIELYIRRAWWDRARKAQRLTAGMAERP